MQRAEIDAAYAKHVSFESELMQEYREALLHAQETKFAAEDARHKLADHRRAVRCEAELKAELEAARTADAERRAVADEEDRARLAEFEAAAEAEEMEERMRQRNLSLRAQLLAAAEKVWGADHASRPPVAVYDMRGPLPPSPPPSPPHDDDDTPASDPAPTADPAPTPAPAAAVGPSAPFELTAAPVTPPRRPTTAHTFGSLPTQMFDDGPASGINAAGTGDLVGGAGGGMHGANATRVVSYTSSPMRKPAM